MDDNIQRLIYRIFENILWKKIFTIIPKCKSDIGKLKNCIYG